MLSYNNKGFHRHERHVIGNITSSIRSDLLFIILCHLFISIGLLAELDVLSSRILEIIAQCWKLKIVKKDAKAGYDFVFIVTYFHH